MSGTIFDQWSESVKSRPEYFVIRTERFAFVFRRVDSFDEIAQISREAAKKVRDVRDGHLYDDWKDVGITPETAEAVGVAHHFAARHTGFMVEDWTPLTDAEIAAMPEAGLEAALAIGALRKVDGVIHGARDKFVPEPWPLLTFLKIRKDDGYLFDSLYKELNRHLHVAADTSDVAVAVIEKKSTLNPDTDISNS